MLDEVPIVFLLRLVRKRNPDVLPRYFFSSIVSLDFNCTFNVVLPSVVKSKEVRSLPIIRQLDAVKPIAREPAREPLKIEQLFLFGIKSVVVRFLKADGIVGHDFLPICAAGTTGRELQRVCAAAMVSVCTTALAAFVPSRMQSGTPMP